MIQNASWNPYQRVTLIAYAFLKTRGNNFCYMRTAFLVTSMLTIIITKYLFISLQYSCSHERQLRKKMMYNKFDMHNERISRKRVNYSKKKAMVMRDVFSEVKYPFKSISILNNIVSITNLLCGLVVRLSGYRSRGHGFDSRPYQIF